MLSFLRSPAPPRRKQAHLKTQTYDIGGKCTQTFYGSESEWLMRHVIPDNKCMMNPPPHLHFYQDETFYVESGSGIWYQPTATNPALREVPRQAGETMHLPPGTTHYFQNASESTPLVVRIRINPKMETAQEECFFRNFFGYLDDCRAHGSAPSVFQLQLFLLTVESALAIPVPGPDRVKWWVSRLTVLLMGVVIGEWLLGYKRSYSEYYSGHDLE